MNNQKLYINNDVENNKVCYNQYMDKVHGKINKDKAEYLNSESKKISDAEGEMSKLQAVVGTTDFNINKFAETMEKNRTIINNKQGFSPVYDQFNNASQNPDKIYLIYENGWNLFLGFARFDIFLIIVTIIVISSVFCSEYESGMSEILLCCKNGKGKLFFSKMLTAIILTVLLCILFYLTDFIVYDIKYGLPNGNYPIQSISEYNYSSNNLSLYQLAGLIFLNKLLAMLYLCLFAVIISVFIKKSFITSFCSILFIIIPYCIMYNSNIKYYIPTPIALILSVNYFKGNIPATDYYDSIKGIPFNNYITIIVATVLIVLTLLFISYFKFISKNMLNRLKFKQLSTVALIVFIGLTSTGCGKTEQNIKGPDIYNSAVSNHIMCNKNFYIGYGEKGNIIVDLENNISYPFDRDPFSSQDSTISGIMMTEDKVYYMKTFDTYNYDIKELDLNTKKTRTIYTKINKVKPEFDFAGIRDLKSLSYNFNIIPSYYIWGEFIYTDNENKTEQYNMNTRQRKIFEQDKFIYNAYYQQNEYYVKQNYDFFKLDLNTFEKEKITDLKVYSFIVTEKGIVFGNLNDGGKIYFMDFNGENVRKLSNEIFGYISFDNDYIYYLDSNCYLFKMKYDGSESLKICQERIATFNTNKFMDSIAYIPIQQEDGNSVKLKFFKK